MKYIFSIIILGAWLFHPSTIIAQSANKLAGEWVAVARKGNNPCQLDLTLNFTPNGKLTVIGGRKYAECKENTTDYPSWSVEKQEHQLYRKGKAKKYQCVVFDGGYEGKDDDGTMIIQSFVGDYMRVVLELRQGDTTVAKSLIFKKV